MTVQDDFTEAAYGRLLDAAMTRFRFVGIAEPLSNDAVCLWRHDIDMSPHRACRLAEMEAERALQRPAAVSLSEGESLASHTPIAMSAKEFWAT